MLAQHRGRVGEVVLHAQQPGAAGRGETLSQPAAGIVGVHVDGDGASLDLEEILESRRDLFEEGPGALGVEVPDVLGEEGLFS